jgi:hypothetical protein
MEHFSVIIVLWIRIILVTWISIRIRITVIMEHFSEKPMLWIRMDPHHFGNLDPHLDPHPHQIKIRIRIRIRIKSERLDLEPDSHQFADDKPKLMKY